ncbi:MULTISPECIES: hypothetical protein [Pseudofrankia]|uniref:hypothetical protein n=1 Tax=Pseudofrankia TaxID=2994363 RepID=UPI000234B199|nr:MULTISPECIES: hypothetical protein [Pseudofrankia]OHV40838.1 hypothetical protein BCD49_39290 [Pseudofrankia sp. EUN1h]
MPAQHWAELGDPARLVPLTVWTTPTPTQPGLLPPAAAARAIATFTSSEDLVLTVGGPAGLADAASYLQRRHHALDTAETTSRTGWSGPAGLVIDHPTPTPTAPTTLLPRFVGLAAQLRPGGFLLTVHPPASGPLDPLAATIAAARAAGLRYLQHIVALTTPISSGALTPPPASRTTAGQFLTAVHVDLAVFTTPGGHRA